MEAKHVIFALLVAVSVFLPMSHQVSARRLFEDGLLEMEGANRELLAKKGQSDSYESSQYRNLEEIDRLKLSINKLICGSMEEGCGHMDDAEDQPDTTDISAESFANLNPHEYVKEY